MNTPTNQPTKTQIYQHEKIIFTEFAQALQKANQGSSFCSWKDHISSHIYIFKNLPTVCPQETKKALGYGVMSGLAYFWALGCIGGVTGLRGGSARNIIRGVNSVATARTTTTASLSPFRQAEKLRQQNKKMRFFTPPRLSPRTVLLIDATWSACFGFFVMSWNIGPLEKLKALANMAEQPTIPEGFADLCDVLVAEYQRQWNLEASDQQQQPQGAQEGGAGGAGVLLSRRQILKQPHSEEMKILLKMIQNCQKRQHQQPTYEQQQQLELSSFVSNQQQQ